MEENWLTTEELATLLDEKLPTVKQWYQREKIDGVKKGSQVLHYRKDFVNGSPTRKARGNNKEKGE